ncbi:hypothetical protein DFH06DRAFT_189780 [Mycena polygramma]|nr:hypothetical protein DFH06DRAFT_189780 [Mycena polygramma]
MWAVYISEAEKYDRSLVESWKSDMEGMLIFAGLFSASLTAFLIESYKTLVPDSADSTAFFLAQISLQLAASANSTTYQVPPPVPFTAPATSLVCNVLWFISLGLSLTCALIATLVEQWARDFLHRADMRSAPVIRARIFSFLYYGLKRFRMHTVVEIIPLLLHASLLLFFIGLVAFLVPVNIVVTAVVALILLTVTTVYALLTLLPLLHLDCPYRTPLSSGFWRLRRSLLGVICPWHSKPSTPAQEGRVESMVDSVFHGATESSDERSIRDENALAWTVKSLADDNELEPFIEAIPDVIWVPNHPDRTYCATNSFRPEAHRRHVYDGGMRRLMNDPQIELLHRLQAFGNTCFDGILTSEVKQRRQIALYKAVWALSCLSTPGRSAFRIPMQLPNSMALEVRRYHCSACSMQQWANLNAAQNLLDETSANLVACKKAQQNSYMPRISEAMLRLHSEYELFYFDDPNPFPKTIEQSHIEDWLEEIRLLPLTIYLDYLAGAARSESKPYHFELTASLLTPTLKILPSRASIWSVEHALDTLVKTHSDLFRTQEFHWLDKVFGTLLSLYEPPDLDRIVIQTDGSQSSLPVPLPPAFIRYLNARESYPAVYIVVSMLSTRGWKCVAGTCSELTHWTITIDHRLTALWRFFSATPLTIRGDLTTLKEIVHSVSRTNVPSITPSVTAMAKRCLLSALASNHATEDLVSSATQHALFGETSLPLDTLFEARLQVLTEFIECCCSIDLPYQAAETMGYMCNLSFFSSQPVHPVRQVQFAAAIMKLCEAAVDCTPRAKLVQIVLRHTCFRASFSITPRIADTFWPRDSAARDTLKAAFTLYITRISTNGDDPKLIEHVNEVVTLLGTSHSEQENHHAPDIMRASADIDSDSGHSAVAHSPSSSTVPGRVS